jgi:8-oxo-dGTP pyrophosphatase MutT (NUDIX family)
MQPWIVRSQKTLLERKWLKITEDQVELSNGTIIDEFHVLHCPDWSSVVAITDDEQIVMVEQYRHGLGRTSLELPSGVIDPGENPLQAAQRELLEETGYHARAWTHLFEVSPEPSRSTHRAHFFVAHGAVRAGAANPETSEIIDVKVLPIGELLSQLARGRVDHAAHVGAILLAERRGLLCAQTKK